MTEKHDLPYWRTQLARAVEPMIGDNESRSAFARSVMARLDRTRREAFYLRGRVAEVEEMETVATKLRDALADMKALRNRNMADAKEADRLGIHAAAEVLGVHGANRMWPFLDAMIAYERAFAGEAARLRNTLAPPRRGRPVNVGSVVITTMVAEEYRAAFAREPVVRYRQGNESGGTPFDRACTVVQRLLRAIGSDLELTRPARAAGAASAKAQE